MSAEAKEKGGGGAKGGHKKHAEHEEHEEHVNHEAWVIPYADLLTLLLAMFLCLWATSTVDVQKFAAVANALAVELGGEIPFPGGDGVLDGGATSTQGSPVDFGLDAGRAIKAEQALESQEQQEQLVKTEQEQFKAVIAQLKDELGKAGLGDSVSFRVEERGLVVTIVTDQVLFISGEADVQIRGKQILNGVVNALKKLDNHVQIEGHTDSRPINNVRYPSNWELSTSRATNVLRYFVDVEKYPADRISASGYGDTKPLASNETADGQSKNRRVELVVLSSIK